MKSSKKKVEIDENSERWLVSYADYSTLLFAFFVVLYATSELNLEKAKKLESSFAKYLTRHRTSKGESFINEGSNFNAPIQKPIKTFNVQKDKAQKTLKQIETYLESNFSEEEIKKRITQLDRDELGIRISFSSIDLFQPQSAELKEESYPILDRVGDWIVKTKYKVLVEAHSYSASLSKIAIQSEWNLTALQSARIVNYLVSQKKISPSRLVALSYGNSRPVVSGGPQSLREKNQRIDFLILTEDSPF